jgi:hypothetical protein
MPQILHHSQFDVNGIETCGVGFVASASGRRSGMFFAEISFAPKSTLFTRRGVIIVPVAAQFAPDGADAGRHGQQQGTKR